MEKSGLFRVKAKVKQYFFLKKIVREDGRAKEKIKREILDGGLPLLRNNGNSDLIISLTSYGKRINDSLPFTLWSLLHQSVHPYKICVYLGKNEVSDTNLPPLLKKVRETGVSFYFVDDIRSYKKLIPALQQFPDNPILTVDDDMYYGEEFVETLWKSYMCSDKKTVIGTIGRCEVRLEDGSFAPYSQWIESREQESKQYPISFYGCGGCLYPPHIFDEEILKTYVFLKLAPTADDLWFWAMEKRCGIQTKKIDGITIESVNRIEKYDRTLPITLCYYNDTKGANDIQASNLIDYYRLQQL